MSIPSAFLGVNFPLDGYVLMFTGRDLVIDSLDENYEIGDSGIPLRRQSLLDCGPSGEYFEERCVTQEKTYMAYPAEIKKIAESLPRVQDAGTSLVDLVLKLANKIFNKSVNTLEQIYEFEDVCRQIKESTHTQATHNKYPATQM